MAKPELGTKRLCANCGAKFYDLSKTPIICPKCETVFVIPVVTSRSRQPEPVAAPVPVAVVPEAVIPETPDVEFVSLEDADADAQGKKPAEGEAAEGAEEEIVATDTLDDAAFIEEQEEGDPDVTDIIGDGIEKEEEA
ncbi:MAG: TIGR02300 family protein [Hyphomicrobiales bacterium]